MMGGRIWVESEPGRRQHVPFHGVDSTRRSCLTRARRSRSSPVARGGAAVEAATRRLGPVALTVNVLLAEDNVVNQRVAVGLLTRRGHT